MSGLAVRQGRRSPIQRLITDPVVGAVVWLLLGLLKVLPFSGALALARGVGALAYYLTPGRQKIGLYNLNQAFPKRPLAWKKKVLKGVWQNLGVLFMAYARQKDFLNILTIAPTDGLKMLKDNTQGGFLLTAHLGCWEMICFDEKEHFLKGSINPVYRPANNPYLEKMLFHRPTKGTLLPKGLQGARKMIELLKANQYIAILNDQKLNEGIAVPFFGKKAMTAPAVVQLAVKYHKPVFPLFMVWTGPRALKLVIEKPLPVEKWADKPDGLYQGLCQINRLYESYIRRYPAQWMWIHRRYDKREYKA